METQNHGQTAKRGVADRFQHQQRRPQRAALLVFGVVFLGAVGLVLAGAWRQTQRREAYLPELEAQVRLSPYDGGLLALLGARLMEAGEYSAAAATLHGAVPAGEQNEPTWRTLAAAVAASGDRSLAIADLRLGLQAQPQAAGLQAAVALVRALGPGAAPAAVAAGISPGGVQGLVERYGGGSLLNGVVGWWGRRHAETSGYATRQEWVREAPGDGEVQRLWGLALLRNRRLSEAGEALERALALAPNSAAVNLAVADLLVQQGRPAKAALQYLNCLKLRPNWLPALLGLGRVSLASGRMQDTVLSYQKATAIAPTAVAAWIGLGHAYQLTVLGSTYDKSAAAYATAQRLEPDNTEFYDDYAVSLYHLSRQDEAEALLRRRFQAAPGDARCHHILGMVLMNSKPTPARQAEAEAQTREALRLSPGNPVASVQLAQLLFERGDVSHTISLLQEALGRSPYDKRALFLLARAYRRTGQGALAVRVTTAADILSRDQQQLADLEEQEHNNLLDQTVHERLAKLYLRFGAKDKAQHERDMIRLVRSDPKDIVRAQQAYTDLVQQVLGGP